MSYPPKSTWLVAVAVVLLVQGTVVAGGPETIVETFDEGNEGGWIWGAGDAIVPTGGNPGAYLRTDGLDTFAPQPRTTSGGAFTGDYRAMGVTSIGIDLITFAVDFGADGRPLTPMLINDNGTPGQFLDDTAAYFLGNQNVPLEGEGWISYDFDVPSQATELPPGWALVNLGDLYAEPFHTWEEVLANVTQLRYFYGNPLFVFIFQQWVLGMDNCRITMEPPTQEGDVNGDGTVDVLDLIQVILDWGPCPDPPAECPSDTNGDGVVDVLDLVAVILGWG